METWQGLLGLLTFAVPGIVAVSKLYTRVQLLEAQIQSLEPMRQALEAVKISLARIEASLEVLKREPHS